VTREQVYGRRPVHEALRGPREVLELWATERAVKSEPWLRETKQPRVQVKLNKDVSESAGTRDHQGVLAWCEPFKYADAYELAASERPLLACLDQVSDPRNLGAVIRSAEGAGATGVVVPAHGSALVTASVCRSSAGAVEHLPVAVVTTCGELGVELQPRGPEHADFVRVNPLLARVEERVRSDYLTGPLGLLDRVVHRFHRIGDVVAMWDVIRAR